MTEVEPNLTHEQMHRYTKSLAERLSRTNPGKYTTIPGAQQRVGKLFIDYFRNRRGASAAGCYSPRARAGLPIAVPTTWKAIGSGVRPKELRITPSRGGSY
jgi:bifunctional non-homologous end joining protein LigD